MGTTRMGRADVGDCGRHKTVQYEVGEWYNGRGQGRRVRFGVQKPEKVVFRVVAGFLFAVFLRFCV